MANSGNLCPYCNHDFGKPIKQKRTCPTCRKTMVIRGGSPVTESVAESIDHELDVKRSARQIGEAQQHKREIRAYVLRELKQCKEIGVKSIVIHCNRPACPTCMAMDGTVFTLAEAIANHPLPVKGCKEAICRCYLSAHEFLPMEDIIAMKRRASRNGSASSRNKRTRVPHKSGCILPLMSVLMVLLAVILAH